MRLSRRDRLEFMSHRAQNVVCHLHQLLVCGGRAIMSNHCCPAKVSGGPSNQLKISMITHG
jgi:hypothetical protein